MYSICQAKRAYLRRLETGELAHQQERMLARAVQCVHWGVVLEASRELCETAAQYGDLCAKLMLAKVAPQFCAGDSGMEVTWHTGQWRDRVIVEAVLFVREEKSLIRIGRSHYRAVFARVGHHVPVEWRNSIDCYFGVVSFPKNFR